MKTLFVISLLLCVSVSSQGSFENEVEIEKRNYSCGSENLSGISFRYCYRNAEATTSNDIIYFFHGLGGSEETWFTQCLGTLVIQKWWQFRGYRPRIVAISFGPQWLLVNNKRFPLLPLFTKGIMPFLEKKMGGLQGGRRHLIGQSMGGFSAAEVALRNPGLFSRVALLCPAITTVGPFSSSEEIENYIERTNANPRLVKRMLKISRGVFLNQRDWENHDPLRLLQKYSSAKRSKFYVSTGLSDGYGFLEGSEEFVDIAKDQSIISKWVPVPGGHCNFGRKATAYFIMGEE
ncbi:alpha/beta hydrolase-fold protein [Bdellovibrio sp.]|uniref:alpha/beta hydrolase-fold protein n=1 Tax=Bdellovibrio sp. TaxID=28201 RepID=UPI0039E6AAC3